MYLAGLVLLAHALGAILLGLAYFRRYPLTRLPVGVINLWDVGVMLGGIVLVPYLYLALPPWALVSLLGVAMMGLLCSLFEPILPRRGLIWLVALGLVVADVGAALIVGVPSGAFCVVNNLVMIAVTVGATNLWAQSGLIARDLAVLAGALAVYDFFFTSQLSLMADLFTRLSAIPFAPLLAWPTGQRGDWLGLGLGDVLMATAFPLAMGKAFGRRAVVSAVVVAGATIGGVLALPASNLLTATFPVMVVLGPLMVAHYVYWLRRCGAERTTAQYLFEEGRTDHVGRRNPP